MKNPIDLSTLKYFEPIPGLRAKLLHTNTQTFAFWEVDKGTILPKHHHIHEQVSIVTKGKLELSIDGKNHLLTKGMAVVIPPNAIHSARAISHVEITDIFTPIREDFLNH